VTLEVRDPRLTGIVGAHVDFERIATGCFTEGPLWHPAGAYLLWSDMPDDHIRRWSAADGVSTFRKPCHKSNGLTWDRQGRLLACEHASSRVSRTEPSGGSRARDALPGQGAQQPQRHVCALTAASTTDLPYGRKTSTG
jgi:gluconolactonase